MKTDMPKTFDRLLPTVRYCWTCQKHKTLTHFEGEKKRCRDCEEKSANRQNNVSVPD